VFNFGPSRGRFKAVGVKFCASDCSLLHNRVVVHHLYLFGELFVFNCLLEWGTLPLIFGIRFLMFKSKRF